MKAPKHPRRYYNVTVSIGDGDGKAEAFGHLTKLNVANVVKMALDAIQDAPAASLHITIEQEPEKLTRMLNANSLGYNHHER